MTTTDTFGLRPFSGLWNTARFRQAEQWLGRPIGTTVLMASRNGAGTMVANVKALMNPTSRNGIPTDISQRLRIVMTVPLAFGRGTNAKTTAGQAEIRQLLRGTAAGQWDTEFVAVAKALAAGGHGADIIRLGHEMTGAWYPWSAVDNAPWYQAAFHQVHDVMMRAAPGLRFEYNCATAGFNEWSTLAYPGDAYVDLIGLDIYNKAVGKNPPPFGTIWQRKLLPVLQAHHNFAKAHGKPVSYAEWANGSQDCPQFVNYMAGWFGSRPAHGPGALAYHSYFDVAQAAYDLDGFPLSKAAFRQQFGR